MTESGTAEPGSGVIGGTIDEAIRKYLSSLKDSQRSAQQVEIVRFARYFGSDTRIGGLKAEDVERYQEQLERSGASSARMEAVRGFLAGAFKLGFTDFNLGKFIKIKRATRKAKEAAAEATRLELAGSGAVMEVGNGSVNGEPDDSVHITRDGYEALKQELEFLSTTKREEISRELYEARIDKDFRENAPYDAAKQHQAEIETRIRNLERVVATARIIEQRASGSRIGLGTTFVLRDLDHEESLTYTLVGTSEANPRAGRISIASPVGRAVADHWTGDEVEVEAPAGKLLYRIESVED